jgi:hypothetical protein
VQGHRCAKVLDLLAEAVGEAGKPAHGHAHGQVLAFDQACRNVRPIGR